MKSQMVVFGCDGTSVMMGVNNEVAAKLKQLCPTPVPIWCVAHRLELSGLDGIKSVLLLAELMETLNGVYKHNSSSAELHAVGKALSIVGKTRLVTSQPPDTVMSGSPKGFS